MRIDIFVEYSCNASRRVGSSGFSRFIFQTKITLMRSKKLSGSLWICGMPDFYFWKMGRKLSALESLKLAELDMPSCGSNSDPRLATEPHAFLPNLSEITQKGIGFMMIYGHFRSIGFVLNHVFLFQFYRCKTGPPISRFSSEFGS